MALTYDVYVAPIVPTASNDIPPGETQRTWSPISATLISGENEAVLVDPLMTIDQAQGLAEWVRESGKNLTTIYATHGHGDHWFGASIVLSRFPEARFVATDAVVAMMRQSTPDVVDAVWSSQFPGQIPDRVVAQPLADPVLKLEGEDLVPVQLGHTDTDSTTCLHVPSIGLVVAGDSAYNDVHLYLAESDPQRRLDWISALDTMESLDPSAVVAGHKRPELPDDPVIIEETRQYIRDFDDVLADSTTALEVYQKMVGLYPARLNPGALWWSANALLPAK